MVEKRLNYFKAAPEMMKAMWNLEEASKKSILPVSLRELVKIRASQINGCAFCIDMHTRDALAAGEDLKRILTLSAWRETSYFNEREQAALLWTETLTLVSEKHAPDEIYSQVRKHFDDQEIVELTITINVINAWNRFAIAFATKPE